MCQCTHVLVFMYVSMCNIWLNKATTTTHNIENSDMSENRDCATLKIWL